MVSAAQQAVLDCILISVFLFFLFNVQASQQLQLGCLQQRQCPVRLHPELELRQDGVAVGRQQLQALVHLQRLQCLLNGKFWPTTSTISQ